MPSLSDEYYNSSEFLYYMLKLLRRVKYHYQKDPFMINWIIVHDLHRELYSYQVTFGMDLSIDEIIVIVELYIEIFSYRIDRLKRLDMMQTVIIS